MKLVTLLEYLNRWFPSAAVKEMDKWEFDYVHNHWRRDQFLIYVEFNESGTMHWFFTKYLGQSSGDYDLSLAPSLGFYRRLKDAKHVCDTAGI